MEQSSIGVRWIWARILPQQWLAVEGDSGWVTLSLACQQVQRSSSQVHRFEIQGTTVLQIKNNITLILVLT